MEEKQRGQEERKLCGQEDEAIFFITFSFLSLTFAYEPNAIIFRISLQFPIDLSCYSLS